MGRPFPSRHIPRSLCTEEVKKSPFLLLEVVIGLGLLAMIFSLLFSFFADLAKVEKKMETARSFIVERQNFQTRLQDHFTSLSASFPLPPIYTEKLPDEKRESLIFIFDQGIDPDPAFSGLIEGRLYMDDKKNLCLASWPLEEKKTTWRNEILLSDIEKISFEFLGSIQTADPKIKQVTPQVGWHPYWRKERNDRPAAIRMAVEKGRNSYSFAFRLPSSFLLPTYLIEGEIE